MQSAQQQRPNLPAEVQEIILQSARQCGIQRVVLFGSRARGTSRRRSDVDLAVRGGDILRFMALLDDWADTLLTFDVVDMRLPVSEQLRRNIMRDGIVLWDSAEQFGRTLDNLHRTENITADTVKDPVIAVAASVKLFETCFEQSWRAMKGILEEHGYPEAASGSPRQIIRLAYKVNLIDDEAGWLSMLNARRLAAHTYNEETAQAVVASLPDHIRLFEALRAALPAWLPADGPDADPS